MNLRRLRGLVGREMKVEPEEELGAWPFIGFLRTLDSMREFPSAGFSARDSDEARPEDAQEMTAADVVELAKFGG